MFNELIHLIEKRLADQPHVVVGISGFGGAGKTTLAGKLRTHFEISDSQVVHLDNMFAKDHANKPILEDYDWPVITDLLQRVKQENRLTYQGRGFYGESINVDVPLPRIILVEGVRLFTQDVISYFDVAVWIDCSPELATQRGEMRDKLNGADETHLRRWRSEWLPKDQSYFDMYKPHELATLLYKS